MVNLGAVGPSPSCDCYSEPPDNLGVPSLTLSPPQKAGLMLPCNSSCTCIPTFSLQLHISACLEPIVVGNMGYTNKQIQYSLHTLSNAAFCSSQLLPPPLHSPHASHSSVLLFPYPLHGWLQARPLMQVKAEPWRDPAPSAHSLAVLAFSPHSPHFSDCLSCYLLLHGPGAWLKNVS